MQHAVPLWILLLLVNSQVIAASTLLRTAEIARGTHSELEWLANSSHRRQLLGEHSCKDPRWGPLRGRVQLLLQLADGYTREDADRLAAQLHADGAVISSSLPKDTWLLLASPDSLSPATYSPHVLVPYQPSYKVAPEWHAVLQVVEQQQQHGAATAPEQHLEVHKRILAQGAVEHLRVTEPAQQHRHAAAAAAADTAVSEELKHSAPSKVLVGVQFAGLTQADLQRLGVQPSGFHPAEAAAADWADALQAVVQAAGRSPEHQQLCAPELVASSPWELDVAVCPQDLSEVLYWLSNQAVVHWLAPRPKLYYQNLAATKIVQSSTMKTALDYRTPDVATFWAAGLDGSGQIVGMGDSGIDMHSCFFADPAVPFVAPTDSKEWYSPQHRKVVFYWGLADELMKDLVGHGTHTAGSVAGFNPAVPDSKATGAAKSARLAFADLSRTAGGDVNAPQDLELNYFPKLASKGACIFTDSWGSTSPVYDFQASKLDSWLYANQNCISHFAAGNYGENDNLDSTITSPATAKNAVTVGATKSATPNYISTTIAPVFMMSVEIKRANKPVQYMGVRLVKADFGGNGTSLSNKGLRMVRASPDVACGALDGAAAGAYVNAIVLVRRGTCYFSQKLAAGAAAGAAAVVVVNDKAGQGYFSMNSQDNPGASGDIPLFAVTRRIGEQLWSFFENAESVAATIERYAQGWPAYEDIASFSSFGPTADGRIKPDIVAPGELTSAGSADGDPALANTNTCNINRKAGTSMATPLVAGHTALIRQYFMAGLYPTGAPGNAAYLPSGPLMKGVMLGGACDMQGNTEQLLPLEDSPSMRQGFGRLCLCNALKLQGNCTTNVQFVDRVPIASQEYHEYCLTTEGGDVRITLVWYDYPAQVSAQRTLVNDLDLTVVSAGMNGQVFYGNMEMQKDSTNTVERVSLHNVPRGGLHIRVAAGLLSPNTKTQNYSLVVQGYFNGTLNSPYNPDPSAGRTLSGCSAELMAAMPQAQQPAAIAATAAKVTEEKGAKSSPPPSSASPAITPTAASPSPAAAATAAAAAVAAVPKAAAATVAPARAATPEVAPATAAAKPAVAPSAPVAAPAVAAAAPAAAPIAAPVAAPATPQPAVAPADAAAAARAAQAAAADKEAAAQQAAAAQAAASAQAAAQAAAVAAAPQATRAVEQPSAAAAAAAVTTPAAPQPTAAAAVTTRAAPQPTAAAAVTTPAAAQPTAAAAIATPAAAQPTAAAAVTTPAAAQPTAAAAVTTPAAAPAAPVAAAAAAVATPAVAPAPVPQPPVVAQADQAALVSALMGSMQAQPAAAQTAPAATAATATAAAQGRRLTWASMPAWMLDSSAAVSIKVPQVMCNWLNASSRKPAAGAASTAAAGEAAAAEGVARTLQAHAELAAAAGGNTTVDIPLQHLAMAGAALVAAAAVVMLSMHRHRIHRSISLTSALHKDTSLRAALASDSCTQDCMTPTTLGALKSFTASRSFSAAAAAGASGASPFASRAALGSGNSSSSKSTCSIGSGRGGLPSAGLGPAYAADMAAAHSAPIRLLRSAPVTPVGTPPEVAAAAVSECDFITLPHDLSCDGTETLLAAAAAGPELRLFVDQRAPAHMSAKGVLRPAGAGNAGSLRGQVLSRLQRCSHSFTAGAQAAAPGRREVFGLSAVPHASQPSAAAAAAAGFEFRPGQLQQQQQLREPLPQSWRRQSTDGAGLQPGRDSDCEQQRDQQADPQGC